MTTRSPLADIAADRPGAFDQVLQNCRFEGLGVVAYGGEDIREAMRPHGVAVANVRTASHPGMAAFSAEAASGAPIALFADVHEGWITRLWMLGPAAQGQPPLNTGVPADLDLDQRGGSLGFDPSDHPALDPEHGERVAALGRHWLSATPAAIVAPLRRPRPVVVRAFSDGDRTAALFRMQGASAHGLAGFYAAAILDGGEPLIVVDEAGRRIAAEAPWIACLRPTTAP